MTEPRTRRRMGPLLLVAVASGLLLGGAFTSPWDLPKSAVIIVPFVILLVFVTTARREVRCQTRRRDAIVRAWQHAQLDEWDRAKGLLESGLTGPLLARSDRGQAFLLLAAIAEQEGRYDQAVRVYERLTLEQIGDSLQIQQAQIALAAAKLRNQELTDAVALIGRLEKVPMPTPLRAALDLVRLAQQVFMGHYEDAVQELEERKSLYRRFLSTRAGYGYGLLAAAMQRMGRLNEAGALWGDATALVRPERLVAEYPVVQNVAEAFPATERPI